MEAELMGLETQMCHKSVSTQHWIVLLFFFTILVGEVGSVNVTRLPYTTSATQKQSASYTGFGLRLLPVKLSFWLVHFPEDSFIHTYICLKNWMVYKNTLYNQMAEQQHTKLCLLLIYFNSLWIYIWYITLFKKRCNCWTAIFHVGCKSSTIPIEPVGFHNLQKTLVHKTL